MYDKTQTKVLMKINVHSVSVSACWNPDRDFSNSFASPTNDDCSIINIRWQEYTFHSASTTVPFEPRLHKHNRETDVRSANLLMRYEVVYFRARCRPECHGNSTTSAESVAPRVASTENESEAVSGNTDNSDNEKSTAAVGSPAFFQHRKTVHKKTQRQRSSVIGQRSAVSGQLC